MDRHFKLIIEYDGTYYCGWQRQPNGRSIQQTIEAALSRMTRRPVVLTGSGRTDAGVHALGQVAGFACDSSIDADGFRRGLNSLLPDDIVIRACEPVPPGFHARFDAIGKTYRYTIHNAPLRPAIGRQYAWWVRAPLDLPAMVKAAADLVGRRDFKTFEAAGSPRSHTIRHVTRADVGRGSDPHILFEITADGFLRHMVRNITGALVAVGKGTVDPTRMPALLAARNRALAPPTAPAHGLCLVAVAYPSP